MRVRESTIEQELIEKLGELKYTLRPDIRDRAALEANFRQHFQALNKVTLTDAESPACWTRSSPPTSSLPPTPCATATPSPAMTAPR